MCAPFKFDSSTSENLKGSSEKKYRALQARIFGYERTTLRVKFQVRMVNTKAKEQFMNTVSMHVNVHANRRVASFTLIRTCVLEETTNFWQIVSIFNILFVRNQDSVMKKPL